MSEREREDKPSNPDTRVTRGMERSHTHMYIAHTHMYIAHAHTHILPHTHLLLGPELGPPPRLRQLQRNEQRLA